MDDNRKMQFALILSDIAEGIGGLMDNLKLMSNALDDVANMLRDEASIE